MHTPPDASTPGTIAHLAVEVRWVRTLKAISQNEVARRAGIEPTVLSKLLSGAATAGPSEKKLRQYLGRVRRAHEREQAKPGPGRARR